MYTNRNTNKLKYLSKIDKRIFRLSELALLWNITNPNTLKITISRAVSRGELFRLKRGLYATIPVEMLDPYEYGCAMAGSLSYISAETVLSRIGAINQLPSKITLFGQKTLDFSLGNQDYYCLYLHPHYLSNRQGITDKSRYSMATSGRAMADLHHVSPKYYIDNPQLVETKEGEDIYVSA